MEKYINLPQFGIYQVRMEIYKSKLFYYKMQVDDSFSFRFQENVLGFVSLIENFVTVSNKSTRFNFRKL